MPTSILTEFMPAQESLNWAHDAIQELREATIRFGGFDTATTVAEFDPQTGERVLKVKLTKPIPTEFARKATEALNNMRHACDQATFAARNIGSGFSNDSVYYPWSRDIVDTRKLLEKRGIDQRLWDTFIGHEPYERSDAHPGQFNMPRVLAAIANSKHTVGLGIKCTIKQSSFKPHEGLKVRAFRFIVPVWDPVKNEAEFLRWVGDPIANCDYQFTFEIMLQDSRLPYPVNILDALEAFARKTEQIVETLNARCTEIKNA